MLARSGGDPLSEKRRVQGVPTFAEAARRVLEQKRGGWRGRWHVHNWWRSMQRYVFPRIGARPVSEVNTADILEILSPIWHVKAATAREVRQRIRSVLEWAIALDMRADNPCDRVVPVLGPQNDIVTHRQALPHKDVAAAIETVRDGSAQPAVRLAFEFLVLTAARSGEVRLATWDEIDTGGAVWTVPAARMKAKREHRVPLRGRALEVLDAARALGDGNRLVFPMRSGRSIASSTFPKMLQCHEVAAVPHGFRSSFRDWAAEMTDHPRDVIEAALAHVVQNKVEAAYARSDLPISVSALASWPRNSRNLGELLVRSNRRSACAFLFLPDSMVLMRSKASHSFSSASRRSPSRGNTMRCRAIRSSSSVSPSPVLHTSREEPGTDAERQRYLGPARPIGCRPDDSHGQCAEDDQRPCEGFRVTRVMR